MFCFLVSDGSERYDFNRPKSEPTPGQRCGNFHQSLELQKKSSNCKASYRKDGKKYNVIGKMPLF
jgi:hypothetical protein